FLGAGQLDETLEPLGVRGREPLARAEQLLEARELRDADRAEDVGEPVIEPRGRDLERAAAVDAVVAHLADPLRELGVVRRDRAALARRDDLARMERQAAEPPQAAARTATLPRAERTRRVPDKVD